MDDQLSSDTLIEDSTQTTMFEEEVGDAILGVILEGEWDSDPWEDDQ